MDAPDNPKLKPVLIGLVQRFDIGTFETSVVYIWPWLVDIFPSRDSSAAVDGDAIIWAKMVHDIGDEDVWCIRNRASTSGVVISWTVYPRAVRVADMNLPFAVLEAEGSSGEDRNWIFLVSDAGDVEVAIDPTCPVPITNPGAPVGDHFERVA